MSEIVLYTTEDGIIKINVQLENETVWLTQKQLVELYQTAKSTVSEHIKNIYTDEELTPDATVRKIRTVQNEGKREVERALDYYNLDMIIALGYRINSKIATQFRIWATQRLKEYIVKGFTMDALKTWVVEAIGKNCCNASEIFEPPKKCFIGK